jgi:hypothetical protein
MYVHMIVSGFGCPANRCMHSSTKTKRMGTFPENWLFPEYRSRCAFSKSPLGGTAGCSSTSPITKELLQETHDLISMRAAITPYETGDPQQLAATVMKRSAVY